MSPERDPAADSAALFAEAVSIMARLRGPDGCPWDREQSFDTIRKYTLEEAYEVFDAIERRHWKDLSEELGDLLLQVLFYAQMASESGYFTIADVIAGLNRKLIRRHPHVFGDEASVAAGNAVKSALETSGIDAPQVLRNWDAIKQAEKAEPQPQSSALDSIPRSLPSLLEAAKLGSRARKSGFDWPDVEGIFAKLEEETEELRQAIGDHPATSASRRSGRHCFRSGRHALYHGQPGPAAQRGTGVCPAPYQREVPPPLCRHGSRLSAAPGSIVCRPAGVALEPGQT